LPTGEGKTVAGLYLIAQKRQPVLIIVHSKFLLEQWQKEACKFLGMKKGEVGLIGGGHYRPNKHLTIGVINSVHKHAEKICKDFGFIISDESHRNPAKMWFSAVSKFDARYRLGLTATDFRRDKLSPFLLMGEVRYRLTAKESQDRGHIMRPELIKIMTGIPFHYDQNDKTGYSKMLNNMVENQERNELIINWLMTEICEHKDGIALLVSRKVDHCQILHELMRKQGIECHLLTGAVSGGKRKIITEELRSGKVRAFTATLQLIGEGFDLPELSSIFVTLPVTFSGAVEQMIGRILRTVEGKSRPRIYDFVDNHWVLKSSFNKRHEVYKKLGILDDDFLKDFDTSEKPIDDQGHEQRGFPALENFLNDYY